MNDVKRVLIVEDLPADAELVEREVRRVLPQCEFLRVETRKDFLAALETFQPDIILSDYRLPQFDGMLALKLALEHVPDIPFIITTGSMNEDTAVECMKTGAWDYIIKQHLKRLGPAVLSCLEQKRERMERQKTEAALRESEDRYRDLVENSNDLICTHDLEGNLLSMNKAAARLTGYSRSDLMQMNLVDLIKPEMRRIFGAYLKKIRTTGHARGFLQILTAGGEIRIWEYDNTLRTDGMAVPIVRGMARDITESRQAAEALRESDARFRSLYENTALGIYSTTPDGRILMANPSLVRMLGYTSFEALAERNLVEQGFEPEYSRREFQERLEREGVIRGLESAWKRNDGSTIFVRESARVIRDAGGNSIYYEGTAEDITERKQAEEALRAKEEQEREFSKRLVKLLGAINLLAGEKSFDDLCRRAVETALENLGFDRVGLWFFSDDQQNSVGSFGTDETGHVRDERGIKIPISSETLKQLFKSKEPVLAFEQADLLNEKSEPVGKGQHAVASLSNGDQVIGYFAADNLITRQPITHNDQELLSLFATSLAHLSILKRAEESLRESEEKMRMIVEGTPFFFFYTQDAVGDMVYISPTVEKITGRTVVEWMGQKHWFATDNPINLKAPILTHRHLLGENSYEPLHFELTHKNGSAILLEIFESPIFRDGKVIGLQGVAHDITERKKDEEKIKSNLDELQRWQDVMLDREDRVQEIKREVNELCRRLAEPVRYTSQESGAADSEEPSL